MEINACTLSRILTPVQARGPWGRQGGVPAQVLGMLGVPAAAQPWHRTTQADAALGDLPLTPLVC